MKFTPYSYWYVQQPWLLKQCVSIAIEFLDAIQIVTPNALLLITWVHLIS
jgi:hypothetical protein